MKNTLPSHQQLALSDAQIAPLIVKAGTEAWISDIERSEHARHIEIFVEAGAVLRFISAFSIADKKTVHLAQGARLEYFHHAFGTCEDHLKVLLEGDDSSVLSQTLFFGMEREQQNLRVDHVHLGQRTASKMVSRGAVQGKASSHFFGNIVMESGCSGADGQLEEHNLLLSKGAKIEAIPGLEIRHNEVQASHSATLERVDDEKLFYLQSRSLSPEEGLKLLVEGFFWDALSSAPDLAVSKMLFKHILSCLSK